MNVSLQYCVEFSQVQYIDLSEIVQFVKAGIFVITVHAFKVINRLCDQYVLGAKVSPEWRLNLVFGTQKKCPFSLEGSVPSIEVTDIKIM